MSTERLSLQTLSVTASAGPLAQYRLPIDTERFALSRVQGFLEGREDIFDILERHSANKSENPATPTENSEPIAAQAEREHNLIVRFTRQMMRGLNSLIL